MRPEEILFTELKLRNMTLPNRIIRSATYEGMGTPDGEPKPELARLYSELAQGGCGAIITGFTFISKPGRAMHPGQCGIELDERIPQWRRIVDQVRKTAPDVRLVMQIAHTGRQTRREVTGSPVLGASPRRCTYFRQRPRVLDEGAILQIIHQFADSAFRAREAGFDAVQVHAAHGYLIHQFLSPWTNTRTDRWADRPLLLEEIIRAIRKRCGESYPILLKLSVADDNSPGIRLESTLDTVKRLERLQVDALEISYGTMEYALNIIRGAAPLDTILRVNPMLSSLPGPIKKLWKRFGTPAYLRKLIPFSENYNLETATQIRQATSLPVIAVGGFRTLDGMMRAIAECGIDAVALCRPLIREPDIPRQIQSGRFTRSQCTNCNLCTIYCDSQEPFRCRRGRGASS